MNWYGKTRPGNKDVIADLAEREKKLTPEQKEVRAKAEKERRLRNAGADVQVPCSREQYKKIKFIIWQVPLVKYNAETGALTWHGYEYHFEKKILDAMSEDKQFCKAVLSVKPQIERHIKKNAEKAAEINKEAAASQALIKEELESLQAEQGARRNNQVILRENKNKLVRIFTDEDKTKMIDVMSFSQEDLERSRNNLTEKKTKLLKQVKDCDQQISKLESEQKPFDEKVGELREKLDND